MKSTSWASYLVLAVSAGVVGAAATTLWELTRRYVSADDVTKASVFLAAVTIILVAIQIWIAQRQTSILEREDALLQRKEDLALTFGGMENPEDFAPGDTDTVFTDPHFPTSDWTEREILLSVLNRGKSVRGVAVHLYLFEYRDGRPNLEIADPLWIAGFGKEVRDESGVPCTRAEYTKQFPDAMLFGDMQQATLQPLLLRVQNRPASYKLEFRLQSESGLFPEKNQTFDYHAMILE
jgi:hypothetical protein